MDGWMGSILARALFEDAGHKITELTIGEHDIRTDPSILEAMHASAIAGNTGYTMVPGIDTLRMASQRASQRTGVPTDIENVMITTGGQSALYAAHMATCDQATRSCGTILCNISVDFASPKPQCSACAYTCCTRLEPLKINLEPLMLGARSLLINSPNNPSGTVYSRQTHEMIADLCKSTICGSFRTKFTTRKFGMACIFPRALPEMAERSLVIGSIKSHAMTGSRVWIVGPKDMISKLIDLSTNTTYGVPGYIQEGALFALSWVFIRRANWCALPQTTSDCTKYSKEFSCGARN